MNTATPVNDGLAWTVTEPSVAKPYYTCEGKGGRYELLGTSKGAGTRRGEELSFYKADDGSLHHRDPNDFERRMVELPLHAFGDRSFGDRYCDGTRGGWNIVMLRNSPALTDATRYFCTYLDNSLAYYGATCAEAYDKWLEHAMAQQLINVLVK